MEHKFRLLNISSGEKRNGTLSRKADGEHKVQFSTPYVSLLVP